MKMFKQKQLRAIHRYLAPVFFLPLLVTTVSGVMYRVGKSWFGFSNETGKLLMYFHQGTFLGKELRVVYVLLDGLALMVLLLTGIVVWSKMVFKGYRKSDG